VKFGTGERRSPCQISRLSGQRVAPAGRKPIFGPLTEHNTGMTALCAGLPVTNYFCDVRISISLAILSEIFI